MGTKQLVADLRDLESRCDEAQRRTLLELADCIQYGTNVARLGELDTAAFLRSAVSRPRRARVLAVLITIVRDVLFLVPVALIWFELRNALREFGNSQEQGESFLALWQQGFGGTTSTFATVAGRVILSLIVVAAVGALANLAVNHEEVRSRELEHRLTTLGHRVDDAIRHHVDTSRPAAQIDKLLQAVGQTHDSIRDAHSYVESLTVAVNPVLKALAAGQEATAAVARQVGTVAQELAGFRASVERMDASLAASGAAMTATLKESELSARRNADLVANTSGVVADVHALARSSAEALAELRTMLGELAAYSHQLNLTMSDLVFQIERLDPRRAG